MRDVSQATVPFPGFCDSLIDRGEGVFVKACFGMCWVEQGGGGAIEPPPSIKNLPEGPCARRQSLDWGFGFRVGEWDGGYGSQARGVCRSFFSSAFAVSKQIKFIVIWMDHNRWFGGSATIASEFLLRFLSQCRVE